jgi:mono/diheme cytochrome c family protein
MQLSEDGMGKLSNDSSIQFSNDVGDEGGGVLRVPTAASAGVGSRRLLPRRRMEVSMKGGYVFAVAATLGLACATMPHGASETNLAQARAGAAQGWDLFKEHCSGCHGERGEGVGSAPRILGPGALPEYPRERDLNADPAAGDPELLRLRAQTRPAGAPWRDPFRTARDLEGYVSKQMPARSPGSLSAEQYWAIINFMALAHEVAVPPGGINADNANLVKLQVRHP